MPLPKPRKGENQDDFISRCNSEIAKEFPDKDQRNAVCFRQWREKEGNMNTWFDIKAKQDSADLFIYDDIGGFGMPASWLVNRLQALKGKALNVYINSKGGDVFDGIALYNAFSRHEGGVNVTVDGIAASIASVVAQAGTTRKMGQSSALMIHDAWGAAIGNADTMEKARDMFDFASDQIADIYAEKAGGTSSEWRQRMKDETWYSAEQAREAGLVDSVAGATQNAYAGRIFNLSNYSKVPEWVPQNSDPVEEPAEPVQTSPEGQEDTMDEQAIRQALGLDSEGDPVAAIQSLRAQAQDIATGEKGAENALRKENQTLRQQLLTQESDYGQRILALEDRNRQKEAEYAVDSAIQAGRVAPKDKELALKLALNDAEGFARFAANLRIDLNERGRAMDAQMAAIEPTADEVRLGLQMGLTREQIIAQKARDLGVQVPS